MFFTGVGVQLSSPPDCQIWRTVFRALLKGESLTDQLCVSGPTLNLISEVGSAIGVLDNLLHTRTSELQQTREEKAEIEQNMSVIANFAPQYRFFPALANTTTLEALKLIEDDAQKRLEIARRRERRQDEVEKGLRAALQTAQAVHTQCKERLGIVLGSIKAQIFRVRKHVEDWGGSVREFESKLEHLIQWQQLDDIAQSQQSLDGLEANAILLDAYIKNFARDYEDAQAKRVGRTPMAQLSQATTESLLESHGSKVETWFAKRDLALLQRELDTARQTITEQEAVILQMKEQQDTSIASRSNLLYRLNSAAKSPETYRRSTSS